MKKMKWIGLILVVFCVAATVMVGWHLSVKEKEPDFRGVVTQIEQSGELTVFHVEFVDGTYFVAADAKTKITFGDDNHNYLAASTIHVGDSIEGDYRFLTEDDIASRIRVKRK